MIQRSAAKVPQLKLRGNQMKRLAPIIRRMWVAHMDPLKGEHRNIKLALDDCIRIDEILDEHRDLVALPPDAATELRKHCFQFCQMETALIEHFHPDENLFNYTIKSHHLLHIGLIGAYINPTLGACHHVEDLMKLVKRLVCTSVGGVGALLSVKIGMQKYVRGLTMDLDGFMQCLVAFRQ